MSFGDTSQKEQKGDFVIVNAYRELIVEQKRLYIWLTCLLMRISDPYHR